MSHRTSQRGQTDLYIDNTRGVVLIVAVVDQCWSIDLAEGTTIWALLSLSGCCECQDKEYLLAVCIGINILGLAVDGANCYRGSRNRQYWLVLIVVVIFISGGLLMSGTYMRFVLLVPGTSSCLSSSNSCYCKCWWGFSWAQVPAAILGALTDQVSRTSIQIKSSTTLLTDMHMQYICTQLCPPWSAGPHSVSFFLFIFHYPHQCPSTSMSAPTHMQHSSMQSCPPAVLHPASFFFLFIYHWPPSVSTHNYMHSHTTIHIHSTSTSNFPHILHHLVIHTSICPHAMHMHNHMHSPHICTPLHPPAMHTHENTSACHKSVLRHWGGWIRIVELRVSHIYLPYTNIINCTCAEIHVCVAGKGYPTGAGAGCALETHRFTCALA